MAKRSVQRTLSLKRIHYAAGRRKNFQRPQLHHELNKAVAKAATVRHRHHPRDNHVEGNICCFMSRHSNKKADFLFELCTYVPGHVPMQSMINMDAEEVDIGALPINDPETGKPRQVVNALRALALGDALIVESTKGAGGTTLIATFLTNLLRNYVDPKYPRVHLTDIADRSLKETIKRGGGVVEVVMDLINAPEMNNEAGRFAPLMQNVRKEIMGTDVFRASFRSKGSTLSNDDAIAAFSELDGDEGFDKINLVLKDHSLVKGLDRFKIQKVINVEPAEGRHPNRFQVEQEIWDSLKDLQKLIDGKRVLTEDGRFAAQQLGP